MEQKQDKRKITKYEYVIAAVLYFLGNERWVTLSDIDFFAWQHFGDSSKISRSTKYRILKGLCESGIISRNGKSYYRNGDKIEKIFEDFKHKTDFRRLLSSFM